ncbi:hypothetical protein FF2_021986 [Malus domestica]
MGEEPSPSAMASIIFFISSLNSSRSIVPLWSLSNLSNMESYSCVSCSGGVATSMPKWASMSLRDSKALQSSDRERTLLL